MAAYLREREIRALFTLTGGHIFPLLDGCLDARVRVVDTRHEQAAAFAAEGYALRTGRPAAYLVTAGPGFANAVAGLAHASITLAPTLCITGASPIAEDDKGALQELEQLRVAEVYARYAKTVRNTNRIPQYLEMAFQSMLGPTPGPAFLEIPQDIFYKPLAADAPSGFGPRPTPRAAGDPRDIERAAAMLRQAERPAVVVGGGGFWSGAAEALATFAEQTGLPVFTRNAARGLLPDSHPQCYGGSPGLGVFKADLVLVIGSRFNATFQRHLLLWRLRPREQRHPGRLQRRRAGRQPGHRSRHLRRCAPGPRAARGCPRRSSRPRRLDRRTGRGRRPARREVRGRLPGEHHPHPPHAPAARDQRVRRP
jgi:acetolactate synthase-1/2/3 large subunit